MKTLFTALFLLVSMQISAQKYLTRTGQINFEASVPSFEEVAAKSKSVTAILNTENGEFASLALVKGFRFKNALMEEHFNENYAESEKFPKATFKGKIKGFSVENLSESPNTFKIDGELEFHGETKKYKDLEVELSKNGKTIIMKGAFTAMAGDFKIKIPKIVASKLREDVKVEYSFDLNPQ